MSLSTNSSPRKLSVWLPLLFSLVLVVGMLIGMRLNSGSSGMVSHTDTMQGAESLGYGKVEELIRYIEAKYVDEVDRDQLVEEAINSILQQLDPHSNYITAEQLREVNEQLEGSFDGIGVEFMIVEDTIIVVTPLAGGPSEAAGLRAGDRIVMVEDSVIAGQGLGNRDVIHLLRGEKGSQVRVGILRGRENQLRYFTITRDKIPSHSVDVASMLDEKTGYIKVSRFSATTYEEFMRGLEKLVEERGMENLVIDLRHNPGGYLQQATNILSQLIPEKDQLLVYTEGRAVHRSEYESTGRAFFPVGKIVVLIDEGSASASEILAGALQDHDRAYILGRRSFGKGLVQEQYQLRDGSALRLTVARYYTPSGRSIQKPYEDFGAYENEMYTRYENGEVYSEKELSILDSTKYYTTQGRVVYGGGGILPDVFVPLDSVFFNEHYLELRQHAPAFVYRYVNDHPEEFSRYQLDEFVRDYTLSSNLWTAFLAFAAENGASPAFSGETAAMAEVRLFIKARIARQLFQDEGYYAVLNRQDEMVRQALKVLYDANPITAYQR